MGSNPEVALNTNASHRPANLSLPQTQIEAHLLTPATVNSIETHGANNTRRGRLDHVFKPVVEETASPTTTLGEALARISTATQKLTRFGARPLLLHLLFPPEQRPNILHFPQVSAL